jgi:hypothetical protein
MLLWQSEIFEIVSDKLQEISLVVFLELRKNREWHILKEHCVCVRIAPVEQHFADICVMESTWNKKIDKKIKDNICMEMLVFSNYLLRRLLSVIFIELL